jgi:enterochelin esterase-like enzyme
MSKAGNVSRTQVWMDTLGDWSWPGQGGAAAVEVLPPPWVPTFPPAREPAVAAPAPRASRGRRLLLGVLLSALAAVCLALALQGRLGLETLVGLHTRPLAASSVIDAPAPAPLPTLKPVSSDSAGSSIDVAEYDSVALRHTGSFHVYLPPGYASTASRFPVLYLLHGNSQPATAFLELGLQEELDRLIAHRDIPPMIAVMIQGGPGSNNWRNVGGMHYESYVLEVQELIDRMLPTIPARGARAIAGDSMGGYGAMNLALGNPYRFGVVESWLGFFNGLGDELRADRPIISRLGLHSFVYGGEADRIADPSENRPFTAQLRSSGANAHWAIYPGGHTMQTLAAHLEGMLLFAGHALAPAAAAGSEAPSAAPAGRAPASATHAVRAHATGAL